MRMREIGARVTGARSNRHARRCARQLDGVKVASGPPVVLLGAASSPSALDPSILRPGRLDVHVHVPPPSDEQRGALIQRMLARTPVQWAAGGEGSEGEGGEGVSLRRLVSQTGGCSLAQLSAVCREAGMDALREDVGATRVVARHFDVALRAALRTAPCHGPRN